MTGTGLTIMGVPFHAALFDLDGVLTDTARVHEAAWKQTFDAFLGRWATHTGMAQRPFTPDDYQQHVDGKPRTDGVRDFLASRAIELPEGVSSPASARDDSIAGLSLSKNELVAKLITPDNIHVFPGSLAVVQQARHVGLKTAVVSASENCQAVLTAAGILDLFDTVVDGVTLKDKGLRGKPAPDPFLEAARRLEVTPDHAIVIEDAVAGVRAARAGCFGMIFGVDRHGNAASLRQAGAQFVVSDVWELLSGFLPESRRPKLHRLVNSDEASSVNRLLTQEPWRLSLLRPEPDMTAQFESIFALSNGYLGVRGTEDEGTPSYRPGSLLNGLHETWPIRHAEDAYGFARTGQTLVAAPDGMRMRLFADDKQLEPLHRELLSYRRTLHLDRALVERELIWRMPDGSRIAVRSQRMVSLVNRHLACLVYEFEALDRATAFTLSSELANPGHREARDEAMDPRRRDVRDAFLRPGPRTFTADAAVCTYETCNSGLVLACGVAHRVIADVPFESSFSEEADLVRFLVAVHAQPGRPVRVEKFLAYHHSGRRFSGELRFRAQETLTRARSDSAASIFEQQARVMEKLWRTSDVELVGSKSLQFAIRFNIFQVIQASARVEGHGVPAKGLTGDGYEGQYFWDTEIYVLPLLIYTQPRVARALLLHRYQMLDAARARARELRLAGALFPWRTINGEEASASYVSGTAQYHIDADIAFAVSKYVELTQDRAFLRHYGAEMLLETARMWLSLGFFSERKQGKFVINSVTGPDEYTTVVDNNAYTNLMARKNLLLAANALELLRDEYPDDYDRVVMLTRFKESELADWRNAARNMYVPYDRKAKVHLQDDAFLDQAPWDFASVPPDKYPLLLHFHPLDIYRHQVIKQADVMLAAFLLGNEFTDDAKRRIFEYYDPLTTGDSSLSECIQSIVACEVGAFELANFYFRDSAITDLSDLHRNVRDGMHVATCGGTWMAAVYGFAGLRDYGGELTFRPTMPPYWEMLKFRLAVRDTLLEVEVRQGETHYRLLEGETLELRHRGQRVVLRCGEERSVRDANITVKSWAPAKSADAPRLAL